MPLAMHQRSSIDVRFHVTPPYSSLFSISGRPVSLKRKPSVAGSGSVDLPPCCYVTHIGRDFKIHTSLGGLINCMDSKVIIGAPKASRSTSKDLIKSALAKDDEKGLSINMCGILPSISRGKS